MSPHDKAEYFQELALPLLDSLYAYALGLTGNNEEAEDLVQETVLKAFRSFDSFSRGTNVKAWLFRILKNTFINEYHRSKRYELFDPASPEGEALGEVGAAGGKGSTAPEAEAVLSHSMGDEVMKALSALPEEFKSAVYMADVEEMSYQEIADVTGVPIGTVRSRIARARKMLQPKLKRYAERQGYIKGEE